MPPNSTAFDGFCVPPTSRRSIKGIALLRSNIRRTYHASRISLHPTSLYCPAASSKKHRKPAPPSRERSHGSFSQSFNLYADGLRTDGLAAEVERLDAVFALGPRRARESGAVDPLQVGGVALAVGVAGALLAICGWRVYDGAGWWLERGVWPPSVSIDRSSQGKETTYPAALDAAAVPEATLDALHHVGVRRPGPERVVPVAAGDVAVSEFDLCSIPVCSHFSWCFPDQKSKNLPKHDLFIGRIPTELRRGSGRVRITGIRVRSVVQATPRREA